MFKNSTNNDNQHQQLCPKGEFLQCKNKQHQRKLAFAKGEKISNTTMDNYNDQLTNEGGKNKNLENSIVIYTQNVVHKK